MKHKNKRQTKILEIVKDNNVETQEELTMYLNASGYKATQATVSRDIRELHLVKVLTRDKGYRYEQRESVPQEKTISSKAKGIMQNSILSICSAQNIVVIKCYAGMAQAACAAIDSAENEDIIGSLSGDDTIFLVAEDNAAAEKIVQHIQDILS